MKAAENGSDRNVEVHLQVEGRIPVLEEYDEYVDPRDNAICCFVPVDDGDKIKITSFFLGTTLNIFHDAVVDGVYRKAISYKSNIVRRHKSPKKSVINTFLYKTDESIIDTDAIISPLSNASMTQGDGPETIGTIELRIYVTRQFDITHSIAGTTNYTNCDKNIESETVEAASYKQIPPMFQLMFEKNCAPLNSAKASGEQRKMISSRPGNGPWAIFRFHYRSMGAIEEKEMTISYSPRDKSSGITHALTLDPVPPLAEGINPLKDDGDSSTRASSPMPPPTPTKGPQKESLSKSITVAKKQHSKILISQPPFTGKQPIVSPTSSDSETHEDINMDPQACTSGTTTESPVSMTDAVTAKGDGDDAVSTLSINDDDNKRIPETSKASIIKKTVDRPTKPIAVKTFKNPAKKPVEKGPSSTNGNTVAAPAEEVTKIKADDNTIKASSFTDIDTNVMSGNVMSDATQANDIIHKIPKLPISPTEKLVVRPAPISTTHTIVQHKPSTSVVPVTPTKRSAEVTNSTTPQLKRTKVAVAPETPTIVPRSIPGSPSPRPMTIERKLAEQRKLLAEMRKKRQEMAQKQATIDEQMTPYKQRMAEELEGLAKEMQEEQNAYADDEQHFTTSVEILEEFKKAEGDN